MKSDAEQVLCRFQLSNFTRHGMSPLYEWIVETAHHQGLQGATVLKGFFGLRPQGSMLEERTWSISQELPVMVEPVFQEGLITLERAHVLLYRAGPRETAASLTARNIIATARTSAATGV